MGCQRLNFLNRRFRTTQRNFEMATKNYYKSIDACKGEWQNFGHLKQLQRVKGGNQVLDAY